MCLIFLDIYFSNMLQRSPLSSSHYTVTLNLQKDNSQSLKLHSEKMETHFKSDTNKPLRATEVGHEEGISPEQHGQWVETEQRNEAVCTWFPPNP